MTALEDKIIAEFKDGKASVERTLLAVSGLETEEAIYSYQRKLDFIQEDFEKSCPKEIVIIKMQNHCLIIFGRPNRRDVMTILFW